MSQSNGPAASKRQKTVFKALLNWPMVRKVESLVFFAMFLAMPLFAFRVIDYTARQRALQNAAHDLVKDIRRVRLMAGVKGVDVTVEAIAGQDGKPPSYVIRQDNHIEEILEPPKGVSMIGQVTFQPDGLPKSPATFEVHNDTRSLSVDVDAQGVVSMP